MRKTMTREEPAQWAEVFQHPFKSLIRPMCAIVQHVFFIFPS